MRRLTPVLPVLVMAAIGLVLAGMAKSASAQPITMTIVGPSSVSPIAISGLKNLGGDDQQTLSSHFVSTLSRDLRLSGYFRIINPHAYIEDPQKSGYELGKFNFADWQSINAEFLVKGAIENKKGKVSLTAMLFDVGSQRRMMGKRFTGAPGDVREMGRRFADAVLKSVTGIPGPFGAKLAYVSTRAGRFKEVYISYPDGGDLFQVTNNATINLFPAFDHGAKHLLYLSYKSGEPALYLVNLAAKRETRITSARGKMVGGALTPDGRRIVAAIERGGSTNLYLLDNSGTEIRPLTRGAAINVSPSLSADGSQVAFTSDRSGRPQIYVMPLSGGDARRITYSGSYNTAPAFSPDGSKIAYESRTDGSFDIYVIPAAGGQPLRLTNGGGNESPCWSPDGRYIVFSSTRGGRSRIYLMQANNGNIISALTEDNGNDFSPAWSWWLAD
ncbi:MAG: Tol-Pal system beta propeller repeat protein TolB [Candidatus Binataceae bacterium]